MPAAFPETPNEKLPIAPIGCVPVDPPGRRVAGAQQHEPGVVRIVDGDLESRCLFEVECGQRFPGRS